MNTIELKNVYFKYPNGTMANENLNLTIKQGERLAIIGQNGAGKTTAVKLMNGLNKPTQGDVIVNGINTKNRTTAQISTWVGYVFQNPDDQIFNTTVQKEIEFWAHYKKLPEEEVAEKTKRVVELANIEKYLLLNPYEIPYSLKKFVTIASVLIAETPYLILDEPTAGQDLEGIQTLVKIMDKESEEGKGVVTISHDMEFAAQYFDRIVVMADKHIIADGTPHEVFSDTTILDEAHIKKPRIGLLAGRLGFSNVLYQNELIEKL
jgi:energy-coupling factor transport system ATP-binding protein